MVTSTSVGSEDGWISPTLRSNAASPVYPKMPATGSSSSRVASGGGVTGYSDPPGYTDYYTSTPSPTTSSSSLDAVPDPDDVSFHPAFTDASFNHSSSDFFNSSGSSSDFHYKTNNSNILMGFTQSSFFNQSDANYSSADGLNQSFFFNGSVLLNDNSSNPNFTGPPVQPFELSDGAKAGLIVLYSLTTLLSISGNVLVVLVFTRGRRCRTDIRPFLINLAVADLVMALFCMPFTFSFVMMKTWVFSKPMCPIVLFVQHLSVSASVFTNVAIGADRFLVVTFPLRSRVTTDRAKYVLMSIWLCSIALSSVQLVVGEAEKLPDGLGGEFINCDEDWGSPEARRTFTMFVLFITYIIPLISLAVAYTIVGVLLWRRTTPGNADEVRDMMQLQSKRKVVKMLILVVTMFGLCWLPLHTFFLVTDFNPELMQYEDSPDRERFFVALYYSVHWLAMSNSFANPIIYSFTNDSFRADLAYIFYVVFPFCKCLKKLANRQLSMSTRTRGGDRRLHSAFRRNPGHSSLHAQQHRQPATAAHQRPATWSGPKHRRHYNGNRIYLALGQDASPSPTMPSTAPDRTMIPAGQGFGPAPQAASFNTAAHNSHNHLIHHNNHNSHEKTGMTYV